jgi:hypothetical protein
LIIIALCAALVAIWYFYFFKKFSTLQDVDRQTILESFKPDSDGKGYSDDSVNLIKEDLQHTTGLDKNQKMFFEKWYKIMLIQTRKTVLSENRDAYLKNSKKYYKANFCFGLYIGSLGNSEHKFNFLNSEFENKEFNSIFHSLQKKNFRFLSFDEIFEIQNPNLKENEEACNAIEKEMKK